MKNTQLLQLALSELLVFTLLLLRSPGAEGLNFEYHNASELEAFLTNMSQTYPDITHLYSIGKSINGTDLWVIAIGESPQEHVLLRPNVKYVANMHGNEVVGREELLHFVEYLVTNYERLDNVTQLLQSSTVHILPSMNPDGYGVAWETDRYACNGRGRGNANGYDLNRNFPDFFRNATTPVQQETQLVIDWIHSKQFVLSANLHGGAVCVSYPFDTYLGTSLVSKPSLTPDDDVYVHLSKLYAFAHPTMTQPEDCPAYNFTDGITNGAEWYPLTGGMQDYNYLRAGCLEVTLEVSCCKFPPDNELQKFWEADRDPLLLYLMQIHMGVRGIISDANGNPVQGAVVSIQGRELVTSNTTRHGEYWRLLLPGHYRLLVGWSSCNYKIVPFQVMDGQITRLDVTLDAEQHSSTAVRALASAITLALMTSLVLVLLPARA